MTEAPDEDGNALRSSPAAPAVPSAPAWTRRTRGADPADEDGPAFVLEEAEDALIDGDRTAEVGTIRTALRHRDFRIVFLGMFASNIGIWMQNVIVAAMAYDITRSALFVSLVGFANLGPQLLLAVVGGGLADTFDRRKVILWLNVEQLIGSLLLAWIALSPDPSKPLLPVRRGLHRHRCRPAGAGLPLAHPDARAPARTSPGPCRSTR